MKKDYEKEADILAKERDFLTISTIVLIFTLAMFWYGIFYWKDYYNQAMNQLADYKCKEQQYEAMPITVCVNLTVMNAPYCILFTEEGLCCYNTGYEHKNFTTGRFLQEENKIECWKIGESIINIYNDLVKQDLIKESLIEWVSTNRCYDCKTKIPCAMECSDCIEKSQKFTLEELGI